MISKININGIATYKNEVNIKPTEINYIYGCNGSGKTTLSNLIKNPCKYKTSPIEWSGNVLETVVYNRDFIKENFSQNSSIKGIFTLGKDAKESKEIINTLKDKIDMITKQIIAYDKSLDKKEEERSSKVSEFTEKCWKIKLKYNDKFKTAFKGYVGTKSRFMEKCISEENNTSKLLDESSIIEKCKRVFNNELTRYEEFEAIEYDELSKLESNEI